MQDLLENCDWRAWSQNWKRWVGGRHSALLRRSAIHSTPTQVRPHSAICGPRIFTNLCAPDSSKPVCVPLLCGDQSIGIIRPDILEKLAEFSGVFEADKNGEGCYTALRFSEKLSSPSDITEALEAVFQQLRRDSVFPCLKGWRNEVHTIWFKLKNVLNSFYFPLQRYAVGMKFHQGLFHCERAAASEQCILHHV